MYLFNIAFWKIYKKTKMVDPKTASLDANDEEGTNALPRVSLTAKPGNEGSAQQFA